MRKKPYGGLPPRQVKLIKSFLTECRDNGNHMRSLKMWAWLITGEVNTTWLAAYCKTDVKTVRAMQAGIAALKRKRVGRVWDLNPVRSFEHLGIFIAPRPPRHKPLRVTKSSVT